MAWMDIANGETGLSARTKLNALGALVDLKAPLADPALTGTPVAPTAAPGTNTTQISTTAFVTAAVALAVTGLLDFKGATDCSGNPNYPAALKGDAYVVSVAGKIGGAAGSAVDIGDVYVASADNAGGTQAAVGASWFILEHNLAGALLAVNNLSDLANAATARTNLGVQIGLNVQAYSAILTTWAGITPAANVGAFLAAPSSANFAAAMTDETGSGALVFGTTPTLATPVLNGLPTGTGVSATNVVSTLISRDASGNTQANNFVEGFTTTVTAAGTTTLTITATYTQVFTGSSTQTVKLPTTSVLQGQQYLIVNQSSGAVTVQSSGANTIVILAANTSAFLTAVVATPTTAANWSFQYAGVNAASGKVGTINNNLTFGGTDGTTMTFPSTSATIARTDAANTFTGHQTIEGVTSTGATGTGNLVFSASPTFSGTANFGNVSAGNLYSPATAGTIGESGGANSITVYGSTGVGGSNVNRLVFTAGAAIILQMANGVLTFPAFTVATLPAAATAGAYAFACVSDALAPAYGSTVVGGGAIKTLVMSDGSNWKVA